MTKKTPLLFFMLLAISTLSVAQNSPTANELLDSVRKDLSALSAKFEQYEVDANDHRSETSTGLVWLKAPDQFKWQYQQPVPQLISANGQQVWVYDEDLEQVTVKQQRSEQNPIYVLLNKERSEQNYAIVFDQQMTASDQALQWIKMTPKQPSDEVKVVWLGIKDNNLSVLKLQNQLDNTVVFVFDDIERNPTLETGFFTFDVPKGTDVISETADIGEF